MLGIDSGGTKSEALLADRSGGIVGAGRCDFRDPESGRGPEGSGRTGQTVLRAARQAISVLVPEQPLHLIVAGRIYLPRGWLPEEHQWRVNFVPVREQDGPLALAGTTAGVVVLAGTGAFVFARTPEGRELHLDALGPLLGDAGSAFEIGLRAVRAVARAEWHPRHQTTLVEPVLDACRRYAGAGERFSLVEYMLQCRDRSEIASLAQIVDAHADSGDRVARQILEAAADSISETLYDAVDRLNLHSAVLPLIAAGSVAKRSRLYWQRVCERTREFAPGLKPIRPVEPDVVGLMLAASRSLCQLDGHFEARLREQSLDLGRPPTVPSDHGHR